jgi:predicted nucleic acid-binding protein
VTRVFWDTNLFVYLFQGGEFAGRVRQIRSRMLERWDQLLTSALTLAELLVKPREKSDSAVRDHDKEQFSSTQARRVARADR